MKLLLLPILLINVAILESTVASCRCGKHEELRCDYQCEKSCETLDIQIKCAPEKVCRCFCVDGYVRHEKTGECIRLDYCPTCPVNQTYKPNGVRIGCQTCINYQYVRCALTEEYDCYCLPGYVLDESTGFCKSTEDCPP